MIDNFKTDLVLRVASGNMSLTKGVTLVIAGPIKQYWFYHNKESGPESGSGQRAWQFILDSQVAVEVP